MKVMIEVKDGNFRAGDLFLYDGKEFVGISKEKIIEKVEFYIDELEKELAELKKQVNIKLKEYHDILQVLTKEG